MCSLIWKYLYTHQRHALLHAGMVPWMNFTIIWSRLCDNHWLIITTEEITQLSKLKNPDISGPYAKVPGNHVFCNCRGIWGMCVECILILSRSNNLCHIFSTESLNVCFTISSPL